MEVANVRVAWQRALNAAAALYSIAIMATIIPTVSFIPSSVVIVYYFIVPGYFVTLLLRETGTGLERLFYSVAWSLGIIASAVSIRSVAYSSLPINLAIPGLTIVLMAYDQFHGR